MEYVSQLLAVAFAEIRSARRLVRTWLFAVLSWLIGVVSYFYYAVLHGFASSYSATLGFINPRFLMSSVAFVLLCIFLLAMVFLAFDIRARDTRERIAEVLDSRPIDNLTLLGGRLLGLVLVAWVPILVLVIIVQLVGFSAVAFDWGFGSPVEPNSVVALLTIDSLPALMLWCSLVFLLAVTLRNRLVVAVVALALLGLFLWGTWQMPFYLVPLYSGITAGAAATSDVAPYFASVSDLAHRAGMLALTAGFLVLAAALHPRPDRGAKPVAVGTGVALAAVGAAGIALLMLGARNDMETRADWLVAHQARQDAPRPELDRVEGRIVIDPGDELRIELEYGLSAPTATSLTELTFSFNPAMAISELRLNGGLATYRHENGLLIVEPSAPLAAGEQATLAIVAAGVPDPAFGYLDSEIDVPWLTADANTLLMLGTEASMYRSDYAALMPAVCWMPIPGSAAGRDDPERYRRDFFTLDIAVETPSDWLVAGPGKREGEGGRYRFAPPASVPEVALLASRFERRSTEIGGVSFELLLHPKHLRNAELFAEAQEEVEGQVAELLADAEKLQLAYPYRGFSLVETPAALRSFGGGWRLPSVQALPGIALLREYGFPTSRFEFRFLNMEELENMEGGVPAAKARMLRGFFTEDVSGGNPLHGAVRNFMHFQTGARGEGAIALDFVVHELATQLLTRHHGGFFSAYVYSDGAQFGATLSQTMITAVTGEGGGIVASARNSVATKPSVWDRALGAPLAALDTATNPQQALAALWLKGPAIAQSIIDGVGREKAAALLAELRRRHAGGDFTAEDFAAAAATVGADIGVLLGDWLHDAALPGFLASEVNTVRIADDERGQPRYFSRAHVRNDEPVPGLVRLNFNFETRDGFRSDSTAPVRIEPHSAMEFGYVSASPPDRVWLDPYLSLNRRPVLLHTPEVDQIKTVDEAPFVRRPSDWRPNTEVGIVVDDLDEAFTIRYDSAEARARATGAGNLFTADADMDQGLPAYQPFTSQAPWMRQESPEAWGKYRHTTALAPVSEGTAVAVFTASLPSGGRWRLDYHVPNLPRGSASVAAARGAVIVNARVGDESPGQGQGVYDMRIVADGEETPVEFDGAASEFGWNNLGEFDLSAGEVRLEVGNTTTGRLVLADAIRWRPADSR